MLESLRGYRVKHSGNQVETNTLQARAENLIDPFTRVREPLREFLFVFKFVGPAATLALLRWATVEPTFENFVSTGLAAGGTAAIYGADRILSRGKKTKVNSSESSRLNRQ